ncbi:MAG: hypothetical protein PGN34_13780 [Methylobacterium frigidaeris]
MKYVLIAAIFACVAVALYIVPANPDLATSLEQARTLGWQVRDRSWSYLSTFDAQQLAPTPHEAALLLILTAFLLASLATAAVSRRLGRQVAARIGENNRLLEALIAETEAQREAHGRRIRAYVGIASITFQQFVPGKRIAVQVEIRNYGVTPARNIVPILRPLIRTFPDLTIEDDQARSGEAIPGMLAAQQSRNLICTLDLGSHPDVAERIVGGELALYLRGQIRYEDVLGGQHHLSVNAMTRGERINDRDPFTLLEAGNEAT